ncbi:hypothetical protein L9G16_10965 [Shewanella sp. A25]|nr:hypothetical protein [Shewanella shenzhenensis]
MKKKAVISAVVIWSLTGCTANELNAVLTGLNQGLASYPTQQSTPTRTVMSVAEANRITKEREEIRIANDKAELERRAQATQLSAQEAANVRQNELAAAQKEKERAAAEAAQKRQQELAKLERAKAEERKRQAAEQKRLADEQSRIVAQRNLINSFKGIATTCGGGGEGVLYLQSSKPSKSGCDVSFEAKCPGMGSGTYFSQRNYIGGSCMGIGDNIRIGQMNCSASEVKIVMTQASCS